MKTIKLSFFMTSLLLLGACSSSGNVSIRKETSATIDTKVVDGTTTKDQVRKLFGDPKETSFTDSGHELWKYTFEREQIDATNLIPYYGAFSNGTHGKKKTLTIIFDGDKVWHHVLSESKVQKHSGIFG
ncbi:hypothetical protein GT348_01465 [Aristophania vespae]|uniref:Outer membrane protein assembly factor BamE n=1 Tax=Aristophania vespae TaxID=2697033 RepID=A0A6P1NC98_9PROT|nr:outer membrane protein assembly factor BamE [Aristophania vespae]QHI95133.1 hypothetical protein GT348_01465 [Aristophania vespae]